MSTFSELVDDTMLQLYGYTTLQDQATYLTDNISASSTTITVNDSTAISRGVVEIGDEIVWVDSVDNQSGTLTIPPYGRGFRGTTAASHTSGSRVVSSPMFPRNMVKKAINDSIRAVFPDLFGIATTSFMFNPAVSTYALPAGALDILSVSWQTTGPSREWMPIRRWRVDKMAATSAFSSGVTISIYDAVVPGRTVAVKYTTQPNVLVNDSDEYSTVTGLPSSSEDVIRLATAYKLTPYFDSAKLTGQSAAADFNDRQNQASTASALSRFLLQMYQVRLAEETRKLQNLFPIRSHYTR